MILFYIVLGLFLLCGYKLYKSCKTWKEFKKCIFGYTIFGGMVATMLYVCISFMLTIVVTSVWVQNLDCKIISMTSNSTLEGSFILGTGSVNNVKYYYYRIQYDDGGMREYAAPVHLSTIYEIDGVPKVERFHLELPRNITYIVNPTSTQAYKFYVPKGTVFKEFVIR